MSDAAMTTITVLIRCPVCAASGAMIHHDLRSSLVYSCLNCTHEWEMAEGPARAGNHHGAWSATTFETAGTPSSAGSRLDGD